MIGPVHLSVVLSLTLVGFSCTQSSKQAVNGKRIPDDLTIVVGQGGGFTGLWQGYTIRADGSVLEWHGKAPEANSNLKGRITQQRLLSIWNQIEQQHFFSIDAREYGNMTITMRVTANQRTHEVSWPGGTEQSALSADLKALYDFCVDAARSADGK
jgi:hypothetical protein